MYIYIQYSLLGGMGKRGEGGREGEKEGRAGEGRLAAIDRYYRR